MYGLGSAATSKDVKVTKVGEDGVSSSGHSSPTLKNEEPSTSQEVAAAEVKSLMEQIEVLKAQNESLQLEIENLQLQNENLKNIIEIGKSTVETAKKLHEDAAVENKTLKEKEAKMSEDHRVVEASLTQVRAENKVLQEKMAKVQVSFGLEEEIAKLTGQLKAKEAEYLKLSTELSSMKESLKQEENSKILTELKRDDIKSKLVKCRENCRTVEDSKKTLENDYKALVAENKNAAAEIKTLKNHLSSSRAIVVEKAVAKDEIAKIKSELTAKTIEVEKGNIKLKKLCQQLNSSSSEIKSLTDLKQTHEAEIKELKEKLKTSRGSNEQAESLSKLKSKENEINSLSLKLKSSESSKSELQERLDFYIQQCSEFEKTDSRHQGEILVLQNSIKTSTVENSTKVEQLQETIQTLENATTFYKGQVDTLLEQNEALRKEMLEAQANVGVKEDKSLVLKYKMKCDAVEDLMKKQEKIAAQLRRKDWEIENYQKKLDMAFEAGMTITSPDDGKSLTKFFLCNCSFNVIVDSSRKSFSGESSTPGPGQESSALDLSTRKKEDTNNNSNPIKEEKTAATTATSSFLRNRKYSELSEASNPASDSLSPGGSRGLAAGDAEATSPRDGQAQSSLKRSNSGSLHGPEAKRVSNASGSSSNKE